jgi:cerevisin
MFSNNLVVIALCILPALSALPPLDEPVTRRHIVTLKDDVSCEAHVDALSRMLGPTSSVTHEWDVMNSFAGIFSEADLEGLRTNPNVSSIDEDVLAHPQAHYDIQ